MTPAQTIERFFTCLTRLIFLLVFLIVLFVSKLIAQVEDTNQIIKIPVVVHVVYNTDEQNINEDQIKSQITILNQDFRKRNSESIDIEFQSIAADCKIEFELAKYDPYGQLTTGITHTSTNKTLFFSDNITSTENGGMNSWGSNYLNIWVCNLPDGIAGWARDFDTDSATQGVVIDYEFFGTIGTAKSPYNLGRTTTHEVGHFFGLNHLEGTTGGCEDDDGIDDTPNQELSLKGALATNTSCNTKDNTQNFMQTLEDAYMGMFTEGQKTVMRNSIFSEYQNLITNIHLTLATKQKEELNLSLFPNPCSVGSTITTLQAYESLEMFNEIGLSSTHFVVETSNTSFQLVQNIPSGIYLVRMISNNVIYCQKMVVE